MSLQHISVAVDHEKFMKGDVVIVKRTYFNPDAKKGTPQLETVCTQCGEVFPTQFRRMGSSIGSKRRCEVRNVPQCPKCRSRYAKAKRAAAKLVAAAKAAVATRAPGELRVGDTVRSLWGCALPVGTLATVISMTKPDCDGDVYVAVKSETGRETHGWLPSRFELVKAVA